MQVETYEVEEVNTSEAAIMAADGEAAMLVEKLELEGQRSLANLDTGTRLPYRKMTALEHIVFKWHCPQQTLLREYASSIIPVRVLQVAAHCHEQGFFPRIEVWHPKDAKLDPVLVGRSANNSYSEDLFLLARWGEVWKDFSQLLVEAKVAWMIAAKCKLKTIRNRVDQDEAALQELADEMFSTGDEKVFSYYA